MKLSILVFGGLVVSTLANAETIEAVRSGEMTKKELNSYTSVLSVPVKVTKVSDELAKKYVLLSKGTLSAPAVGNGCRAFPLYQSSLYQGELQSIDVAVQEPHGQHSCDAEATALMAGDLELTFQSAMFGDGSGTDVGPVVITIKKSAQ